MSTATADPLPSLSRWTYAAVPVAILTAIVVASAANRMSVEGVALGLGGLLLAALVIADPVAGVFVVCLARAPLEALNEHNYLILGPADFDPPGILNLSFLIGGMVWLVLRMREGFKPWTLPLFLPMFVFSALATVSVVYSVDLFLGVRDVFKITCVFAAYVLLLAARPTRGQVKAILIAIALSAVYPIIVGWYQFANSIGINFEGQAGLRISAVFEHPNTYGLYLVTVLAAMWGLFSLVGKTGRWICAAYSLVLFTALMLPMSRSAWLAAGLIVLFVGWRNRWIIFAALATGIGVIGTMPRTIERIMDVFASPEAGAEDSLTIRLDVWTLGFDLFTRKPVTGFGWGSFAALTDALSHNDYIRAGVELGVIGLVTFVVLIFQLIRVTYRAAKGRRDFPLAMLGFAVAYAVVAAETNSFEKTPYQWYFWVLIGLAILWPELFPAESDEGTAARQTPPPPA